MPAPRFPDPWLERWMPMIQGLAGTSPVLDIGCGYGDDAETLANAGLRVLAIDIMESNVAATKARVPAATVLTADVRGPWPEQASGLGVVVASLSLHYFSWDQTLDLVRRICSALRPGGILLCRLNAVEEQVNSGVEVHHEIEPNFFLVNGSPKRFFDGVSVRALFQDGDWWHISMQHLTTHKYHRPKALWEVIAQRQPA